MPRDKLRRDVNEIAYRTVQAATGQGDRPNPSEPMPVAAERGRKGGLKGGIARKAKLTPEQRKAIARAAAKARWEKHKPQ